MTGGLFTVAGSNLDATYVPEIIEVRTGVYQKHPLASSTSARFALPFPELSSNTGPAVKFNKVSQPQVSHCCAES